MCNHSEKLLDLRIQAILHEVQFIKQEILDNLSRVFRAQSSAFGIFGALFGASYYRNDFQILLLAPWVSCGITLLWLKCSSMMHAISLYLTENIEEGKLKEILGERRIESDKRYEKLWVGWQHFYDEKHPNRFEDRAVFGAIWVIGGSGYFVGLFAPHPAGTPDLSCELGYIGAIVIVFSIINVLCFIRKESFITQRRKKTNTV